MRKRGVLVRRLDAIESLASVSVVCFDKTGTLTMNQMRVVEPNFYSSVMQLVDK